MKWAAAVILAAALVAALTLARPAGARGDRGCSACIGAVLLFF